MSRQEIRRIYRTAQKEDFPQVLRLELGGKVFEYSKVHWRIGGEDRGLRYGTNPHQKAALYKAKHSQEGIGSVEWIKWGKDGPSATNVEDGSHGLRIVRYFDEPAVAVMKHLNPSGVSVGGKGEALSSIYARGRDADPRAAFGSVVVLNRKVDRSTAEELLKTFVEVVYAPDYEESAITVFQAKKDIRIGKVPVSSRDSNTSDGFLPNMDNVVAIAKEGISAIVQPGGSVEDGELIKACDQHGIAMVMTGERSFRHF